MKLDLKQVEKNNPNDGEYTPIEPGRYTLEVNQVEEKTAKTGTKLLSVTFNILGPKFKNRKVWANFVLLEKALIYLKNFVDAVDSDLVKDGIDTSELASKLVGRKVQGYVDIEAGTQGKPRNVVKNYSKDEGAAETTSPADNISSSPQKSRLFN